MWLLTARCCAGLNGNWRPWRHHHRGERERVWQRPGRVVIRGGDVFSKAQVLANSRLGGMDCSVEVERRALLSMTESSILSLTTACRATPETQRSVRTIWSRKT